MSHLHRCRAAFLGGPEEQCPNLWECEDSCVEEEQETLGFCAKHEALAEDLVRIISRRSVD